MVKISEIKYVRPDKDEVLAKFADFKSRFCKAGTVEEFYAVHDEYKEFNETLGTNIRIAFIRFTQDTRDEFYAAEQDYLDEIGPEISVAAAEIANCYLNSKFRKDLEKRFPKVMFKNLQMAVDANDPKIVAEKVEQNKLTTAYTKLMSGIVIDFNGEKLPMSGIRKYFTDPDRNLRRDAYIAFGQAIEDNKDKLDELYDKLVKVRTKMGKKLGYKNFSPLGYLQMQRNCYTKEDIAKFRENVLKYLVPLCVKIRNKVGENLNLGQQYVYDDAVFTKETPKPIGSPKEIFANASKMYNEMSPETGKLFDKMVQCECFDVMSREGKWGGGYCEGLPQYQLPFILSNWNGSAGDIDVLTHEFGHALEFYKSFFIESEFLSSISMETAEVHSMSMEFLVYPWLNLFFGNKTEEYKFYHIGGAVTFIPYGTIVDYFQQTCYDNPEMTPTERNAFYNKIEKQFIPYMSTEGIPAVQDGRRWQRQAHIFESPFYYIDYCFAQFTALQFLAMSQENYAATFENYIKFLNFGGTKTFTELLSECGLKSPFEEDSFKMVVASCEKILGL
ncbi:MAG: M3 family oligoendopeptidase [Corallococcus sp.]|nr:M3 family oligoendopeptidase [Corallococcus sp.]MCM1359234.1 M3 family oligoendopeptidase [Corallococcus sp.]MCM1394625.1 M3 family oligoendopeptidase [Corallococcus sp.]